VNSQSYRADVTSLVSGNGTYSLANFIKAGPPAADVNGASLVVFYNDGNTANDRNVALFNGNNSNFASSFDAEGWDITIPGVNYPGEARVSTSSSSTDRPTRTMHSSSMGARSFPRARSSTATRCRRVQAELATARSGM
jgi:hypothetical protein